MALTNPHHGYIGQALAAIEPGASGTVRVYETEAGTTQTAKNLSHAAIAAGDMLLVTRAFDTQNLYCTGFCCGGQEMIESACCAAVPASISGTISSNDGDLNGKEITLTYDPDAEFYPSSPDTGCWVGFVAAGGETFGLKVYCVDDPLGWGAVAACGMDDSDFTHFVTVADDACAPFSIELTDVGMQLACGALFNASLDITLA